MEEDYIGWDKASEAELNLDEVLGRVRYRVDAGRPHIRLDQDLCRKCTVRACLWICPVRTYWLDEGRIEARWERCQECGACRRACVQGGLVWELPRGGHGVCFRLG